MIKVDEKTVTINGKVYQKNTLKPKLNVINKDGTRKIDFFLVDELIATEDMTPQQIFDLKE